MRRTYAGYLVSPLWVPVLTGLGAAGRWPPPLMRDVGWTSWVLTAAAVGVIAGYAALAVIGVPTHLLLRRRGHHSFRVYLMSWFAAALAAWVILFVASFAGNELRFSFSYLAKTIVHRPYVPACIGAGWALAGATFWLIARPDRSAGPHQA